MPETTNPQAAAEEADVDTVANRAAQVITSMGGDIRALTSQRDRYRSAWCSARERAQAYGEGILRVVKDREAYQEWLRQAEERAAAPAAPSAPADRAELRDRIAEALARLDAEKWRTEIPAKDHPFWQMYLAQADAVLAVLPEPADRAAEVANLRTMYDAATARENDLINERDELRTAWDSLARCTAEDAEALVEVGRLVGLSLGERTVSIRTAIEAIGAELRRLPADWAAILREAADIVAADTEIHIRYGSATDYANRHADLLRRLADEPAPGPSGVADEAQQDETQCARCDHGKAAHNISGCIECPGGWRADHRFTTTVVSQPGKEG
ncbi:hypothetical protein OG762_36615 [Streptomyces sp. NBC_01136]|uniref:hypothetical protein n=1 Tax=Streptomyces sp. NBC_01136 TaxID=2903754 RepID=UPI003869956B|nr:hypothetical protein OG762_36615 [Streptomyces sp. NBC_01136]